MSIVAFIISCYFNSKNWSMNLLWSIPLVTVAPILLFSFFKQLKISAKITQRIIIFLSTASYFMYLFHRPLYQIIARIYFPVTPVLQLLFLLFVCLPIIIITSFVLQKIYNNLLKSLTNGCS